MPLETVNISPRIGVEIKADAATMLSGAFAAEIRQLLDQRGVIVVRDLHLDDEELVAFAHTLGEIHHASTGEVFKVTLNEKENEQGSYLRRTAEWHMDRMDSDLPPLGSMLTPRVLPPWGGETEFTNTYAAFEDLPEAEQRRFEAIEVVHTTGSYFGQDHDPYLEGDRNTETMAKPPKNHPLVWHHRSGRKSLVLGITMDQVVGMDRDESREMIRRLMDWASKPEYVYRHEWRMGDLVIWDNTGTMHRVCPYDHASGRQLHRVTLLGEEPVRGV
jgi:alpha-ketoglutarate-dependent taurine dioxygenase